MRGGRERVESSRTQKQTEEGEGYLEVFEYHPGFEGGEKEGSGDTGQETAD